MFVSDLNQSISKLTGVGKKLAEHYEALGVRTFCDLISLTPRGYEDRSHRVCIGRQNEEDGIWTNTIVRVESISSFGSGKKNVKIAVRDTESNVKAFLMGFNRPFLAKTLIVGNFYHLYANIGRFGTTLQASQFETKAIREDVVFNEEASSMAVDNGFLPVYPLSGTLSQKNLRRDINAVLSSFGPFEDEIPYSLMKKYNLIALDKAIREIHFPTSDKTLKEARKTMAFRELFYLQLSSKKQGIRDSENLKPINVSMSKVESSFIRSLPFSLTTDQEKVLEEIRIDMGKTCSMNRLLQGDVGSGKTLVAWVSALHVICNGGQVAFMAPTELLARQHAQVAANLLEKTGVRVAFLNGEVHGKNREALLKALKKGEIDLLIGTHALFSKDVEYKNLSYVIIDEQHRFGVEQRKALQEKGCEPHVLLMTATPIPRTLALTVFGNLNVSTIRTMPKGRLPIVTHLVTKEKREEMYKAVGVEMERGHQAYFVYPRIDDEGESDLRDVQTMYSYLSSEQYPHFKGRLIHSRLPEEEKIEILNDFSSGKIDFLVSTSVVEVGIDVPNATCMVVEHSERFGLSALHQLRGRVGRSSLQSWCFLTFEPNITDDGKKRLSVLRRTNDGFEIAEEDLKIRGPGELSGLRQSGYLKLKYSDLEKDLSLIAQIREEVESLLKKDPALLSLENSVVREVLRKNTAHKVYS